MHVVGSSITNENKQNAAMVKTLRKNKKSYPKCVSLEYLKISLIRNKFSDIPSLIGNNLDVFIVAKTKLDSSFTESQFLLE